MENILYLFRSRHPWLPIHDIKFKACFYKIKKETQRRKEEKQDERTDRRMEGWTEEKGPDTLAGGKTPLALHVGQPQLSVQSGMQSVHTRDCITETQKLVT